MKSQITNNILNHPFKPIIFNNSKYLILGTFPSIKSFENNFYYNHPRNQFWRILALIFNEKLPISNEEKIEFIKKYNIALWDVMCKVKRKENNSDDNNLILIEPCNIKNLINSYPNIEKIFTTSRKAEKILKKYFNINSIYLPSPSPAYPLKLEKKVELWKKELLH